MASAVPAARLPNGMTYSAEETRWSRIGAKEPGAAFKGTRRGIHGPGRGRGGQVTRTSGNRDGRPLHGDGTLRGTVDATTTSKSSSSPGTGFTAPPVMKNVGNIVVPVNIESYKTQGAPQSTVRPTPQSYVPQTSIQTTRLHSRARRQRSRPKAVAASVPGTRARTAIQGLAQSQSGNGRLPNNQTPSKNVAPRFATSLEAKQNIDALVEKVRAAAMGENRPVTPRSHIDWAGDEDDTLPDLDDWVASKPELMSPIVVDGLKPLPGVEDNSPIQVSMDELSSVERGSTDSSNSLPHSLPARPLSELSPAPLSTSNSEALSPGAASGLPMIHNHASSNRSSTSPTNSSPSICIAAPDLVEKDSELVTENASGLARSIHAPLIPDSTKGCPPSIPVTGSAIGRAPEQTNESASVPCSLPALPSKPRKHVSANGRQFRSDHGHSSSQGRATGPSDLVRRAHHTRAHSTPSQSGHRHNNSQRPVLTGDAISRLAKTIGGPNISPSRPSVVVTHD